MDTGLKISSAAHGAVIAAALVGWPFSSDSVQMAPEAVSVSIVSPDDVPNMAEVAVPEAPKEAETVAALPPPAVETAPVPAARPERPVTPPQPVAPEASSTPPPPKVDRVAPVPQPMREEDLPTADIAQEAVKVTPDAVPEPSEIEEQDAQAPEAAAPEIVTEATETSEEPSLAPSEPTRRPTARPERPAPVVAETPPDPEPVEAPEPDPEIAATPEPVPTPAPEPESEEDAIAAAVAEALTAPTPSEAPAAAPSGPPLTAGEQDGLRVAVGQCWNFSALSTDAAKVTVVVGMSMSADGKPSNLRLVSHSGGGDAAAEQAYETARRAILRCAGDGYSLPREKYDQWRDIEMTFNPERMRRK